MYTPESLLDIHERSHRSLTKLLEHCRDFSADEINREMAGFGYPTLRLLLYHTIGTEEYWIGVIQGNLPADGDDSLYPNIESLEQYGRETFAAIEEYLHSASPEELNTPLKMAVDPGVERILTPALVIMRIQMHLYHHLGQVMAICRLLGKPASGMDFPII